jgi:hypothetical protein
VGIRKFAFDIWGESVNVSSRMESSGAEGCINVSLQTYARIKDFFVCESRGQIMTKDKVGQEMFFVRGVLPALMEGAEPGTPPPAFTKRYGIYFQATPPAFPDLDAVTANPAIHRPEISPVRPLTPSPGELEHEHR